jgi:hypothetical protein
MISSVSYGVNVDNKIPFYTVIIKSVENPIINNNFSNPYVEITYPENGTDIPYNFVEVLGYAMDNDGIKEMIWTWECGPMSITDNDSINNLEYLTFRISIFNLPIGTHKVTVTFIDIYNNSGSDYITFTYGGNSNPNKPNRPIGPDQGIVNNDYTFSTHSVDPDDDDIRYGWDWDGDNVVDEWTEYFESGVNVETNHFWSFEGIYNVKVKAEDILGKTSDFSLPHTIHISSNNPPDKPSIPDGSLYGRIGVSYSYSSSTIDIDGDKIYYLFDWDDETTSGWHGPYSSADTVSISHIWENSGSYQVKVKAKDDPNDDGDLSDGMESYWSDPLAITMPRGKPFLNFVENYPLLYRLLQKFLR